VDGLTGLADTEGDHNNLVTLDELENYIGKTVPAYAQQKYNRKQNPFLCCDENKKKVISKVDTAFLKKWIATKKMTGQIRRTEGLFQKRSGTAIGRSFKIGRDYDFRYTVSTASDTSVL